MNNPKSIGFIGLGLMGAPIARRLQAGGCEIATLRRHRDTASKQGYRVHDSPAELADACDVVFTCLPSPESSVTVYDGPEGLTAGRRVGSTFIELSTTDHATMRQVAAACERSGADFVDAPVSGGPAAADAGTLTVMAGGSGSVVERLTPLFALVGKKIFHMGGVGAGMSAKICNQMITGVTHALVAEAMVLGERLGLDAQKLFDVLRASSGQSNSLERAVPRFIIPREFTAAFSLHGITKDIRCVLETGDALKADLVLARAAYDMYRGAQSDGLGSLDAAAIFLWAEGRARLDE